MNWLGYSICAEIEIKRYLSVPKKTLKCALSISRKKNSSSKSSFSIIRFPLISPSQNLIVQLFGWESRIFFLIPGISPYWEKYVERGLIFYWFNR